MFHYDISDWLYVDVQMDISAARLELNTQTVRNLSMMPDIFPCHAAEMRFHTAASGD